MRSLCWVLGAGGLLGSHVEVALARDDQVELWRPDAPIRWEQFDIAAAGLSRSAAAFLDVAAHGGRRWRLMWCAGAGVVQTTPVNLAQETTLLACFLGRLCVTLSARPDLARRGSLFFASSAGGVYSASPAPPPFHELSPVGALAP